MVQEEIYALDQAVLKVRNTLAAEILALQEVTKVAIVIKCMLLEILNQTLILKCITDNKSLHDAFSAVIT